MTSTKGHTTMTSTFPARIDAVTARREPIMHATPEPVTRGQRVIMHAILGTLTPAFAVAVLAVLVGVARAVVDASNTLRQSDNEEAARVAKAALLASATAPFDALAEGEGEADAAETAMRAVDALSALVWRESLIGVPHAFWRNEGARWLLETQSLGALPEFGEALAWVVERRANSAATAAPEASAAPRAEGAVDGDASDDAWRVMCPLCGVVSPTTTVYQSVVFRVADVLNNGSPDDPGYLDTAAGLAAAIVEPVTVPCAARLAHGLSVIAAESANHANSDLLSASVVHDHVARAEQALDVASYVMREASKSLHARSDDQKVAGSVDVNLRRVEAA